MKNLSDLISRKKLIESIKKFDFGSFFNDTEKEYIESTMIALVNSQATDYDIDKVVEELKCDRCESCNFLEVCAGLNCCEKCREKAIEIVKHGGVSDDVYKPSADKIKVTSLEVIVTGSKRKPYFEIKYKEVGTENYNIGYSSYNLDFVLDWKEKCFELVKVVE